MNANKHHQEFRLPSSSSFCWEKYFTLREKSEQEIFDASTGATDFSQEDGVSRLINIIEDAEDVLTDDLLFEGIDFDPISTTKEIYSGATNTSNTQAMTIPTFPQINGAAPDATLDHVFTDNMVQEQGNVWSCPPQKRKKTFHEDSSLADVAFFNPLPFNMNIDYFRGTNDLKDSKTSQLVPKDAPADASFNSTGGKSFGGVTPAPPKATNNSKENSNEEVRFRRYQADQWMERFEDLINYKEENCHCLVPHSYPENQQLAQWVKRQRYQFKLKSLGRHSTLTDERQKELEDMGFVWDSHKAAWYERLEALKKYHAKHGNCMVPTNYEEDRPLAVWVKCQRRQLKLFRKGRRSTMTEDRFQELEKLGFEWNPRNL